MSLQRIFRRLRYGKAIIVVSGLPRSGTSMMMQMLAEGGLPPISDGVREPDDSNPKGYFELERVKELQSGGDTTWLRDARGGAVKIVAYLLRYLPDHFNYRVILMQRDLTEILVSQTKMLRALGEEADTEDDHLRRLFEGHLSETEKLLSDRSCFDVIEVEYRDAIEDPERTAMTVARFVGGALDVPAMAAAVSSKLYRNRRGMTP